MDAAASGLNFYRPAHVAKIYTAAARGSLHFPAALPQFNAPAAGLKAGALRARLYLDTATTRVRHNLAVRTMNLDRTPTGVQTHVAADCAHVNGSTTGLCIDPTADIVEVHASTT